MILFICNSNQKTRALHLSERESVLNKYFSKEEILAAERKMQNIHIKQKYSFFEMLFSVKNSIDLTRKIITVSGIHFKIKKSK